MPDIRVERIDAAHPLYERARAIRKTVFIEEQNVSEEEEWDSEDERAVHLVAVVDGRNAGTLRLYDDGGRLHIGRVAVLPEFRSRGLGRILMDRAHEEGTRLGLKSAFLNAQVDKSGFYQRLGYSEVGDSFLEAGIMHIRMERRLQ